MVPVINGLILTIINIGSILIGYYVYYVSNIKNQIAIQVTVACLASVVLFIIWKFICFELIRKFDINKKSHYIYTFLTSLIWTPVIFIPLHFIAEGYITSIQNILGIWLFQVPTNILILKIHHNFSTLMDIRDRINTNRGKSDVQQ